MRVLVIGATGAIGSRLVPALRERGHQVIGTSRSQQKAEQLRAGGSGGIALDVLDAQTVREAVRMLQPDAIIYEATSLSELSDFKHFDRSFAPTNRLRTQGIDNVLAAARDAGVQRVVAQSYAPIRYERRGGPVKTEDDPLDANPPAPMRETVAAMNHLDRVVTDAGGIALRYGTFYGDPNDPLVAAVQAHKWPIVGDGGGIWSFIHLEDAATATALALEREGPAIYNITDDAPTPARVWLTELAKMLGAKPPQRFPKLLARIFAGDALVVMSTESRGASNAKAKRELNWALRYPSWRQGFAAVHAAQKAA